jgi:hypothetical protein
MVGTADQAMDACGIGMGDTATFTESGIDIADVTVIGAITAAATAVFTSDQDSTDTAATAIAGFIIEDIGAA